LQTDNNVQERYCNMKAYDFSPSVAHCQQFLSGRNMWHT